MKQPPAFCSIETLAEQLDCSVSTVRSYREKGVLPAPVRIGGLVRYRWSEVVDKLQPQDQGNAEKDAIMEAALGE